MLRRPRTALLAALACFAGLAVTLVLAYFAPPFTGRDAATLQAFMELNHPRLTPLLSHVAHLADPAPYALMGLALVVLALIRRRARVAAAIAVILIGSAVTTQALKPLLAHPRVPEWLGEAHISAAAWPSGHATAAMALALCAVLAVPARWRATAATIGGMFALAVAYAIVALAWHFPSDVIGGFLVAGLWASLGVGAIAWLDERRPPRAEPVQRSAVADGAPRLLVGATFVVALLIAAERPRTVASFAQDHPAFVLGAATIAALAAILTAAAAAATARR